MQVADFGRISAGVDVGGTFTDVAVAHSGGVWRSKAPTTHGDIGRGVIASLAVAASEAGLPLATLLGRIAWFGLGTTAVTNVIAEVKGRRVGLLTTLGFEDELNLARGIRFSIDGPVRGPEQIISPQAIAGLAERIDKNGHVLQALDPAEAVAAVERLVRIAHIECIAISFVNAYRNPAHERAVADAVRRAFPGLPVAVASDFDPAFGFLPRTMGAVLNAFAGAAFEGIDALARELSVQGLTVPVRLVNATGGVMGIDGARQKPLLLLHSGPAAGAAAAATVGLGAGFDKVLACDMGGTSFDISVIQDGQPLRRLNAEILRVPTSLSVVDVDSVGAGGGSIGWADARGMLRVGPHSAGSSPGPACYGWGGTEPTVTDALVVLGYIDPARFLGGRMTLDAQAAQLACERLGAQIGLSPIETAWGIRRIAFANMTRAAQLILSRRGLDPTDFSLVSYGGCGGLFNVDIARELAIANVLIPSCASVLSAYGAATAPIRRERSRAIVETFPLDAERLARELALLERAVIDDLESDQVKAADVSVTFEAAIRFKRQPSDLPINVRRDLNPAACVAALQEDFRAEYRRRYGESSIMLGAPMEMVVLRASGTGPSSVPAEASNSSMPATSVGRPQRFRDVWLEAQGPPLAVPVYDSSDLSPGMRFIGPACIDASDTTLWVSAQCAVTVGKDGSLGIRTAAPASDSNSQEAA
jgi:N-methylhydantoinase A